MYSIIETNTTHTLLSENNLIDLSEQLTLRMKRAEHDLKEASLWPQFPERKANVLSALKADPHISLDAAYRKVIDTPPVVTGTLL